jgi:hemoglobin
MKTRSLAVILVALLVASAAYAQAAGQSSGAPAGPNLYKRLGGYDAIAAVSDDFVPRLIADKQVGRFLVGLSENSKGRLRQMFVEFVCAGTGGPCIYTGRDMKTSHKGMGITASDWDISVKHLVATLEKFKVPEKEKTELLTIVSGLKGDIVEKP